MTFNFKNNITGDVLTRRMVGSFSWDGGMSFTKKNNPNLIRKKIMGFGQTNSTDLNYRYWF